MIYCSSLFQLPPFTPSCIPPTPPKKINWWEGLRWASVVFGSCYLRTLPTQFVLLPAKTLPGLLQQNKRSSHASSCPWPTARCEMFIAQKWGHCPLHFYFLPCFSTKAVQDNLQSPVTGLRSYGVSFAHHFGVPWRHVGVGWCWQEVRGEKEGEKNNWGGGQPTLILKAHQHLCLFSTIRTHALQR